MFFCWNEKIGFVKIFKNNLERILEVGYLRQDVCRETMEGIGNEIKVKVFIFKITTDPHTRIDSFPPRQKILTDTVISR